MNCFFRTTFSVCLLSISHLEEALVIPPAHIFLILDLVSYCLSACLTDLVIITRTSISQGKIISFVTKGNKGIFLEMYQMQCE